MHPDLQQFVRDALARGIPRPEVRRALEEAGWSAAEIDGALEAWADLPFPLPVPRRRPYLSAREAFLHLVMFVTLWVTAFHVGVVLFEAVERWVPDPVARAGVAERHSPERVRGAAAAVLIAFPIFLLLSRAIGRELGRQPARRASRIRRWLTYLTLFAAALVLIGDLTVLVSRLLSGELPPRFLLKTVVVFAVAGTVFGHYLGGLRREEGAAPGAPPRVSPLARAAGTAVLCVLALGLVMAGSPRRGSRPPRYHQRVADLQVLSGAVQAYYHEYRRLPASLTGLGELPGGGVEPPRDPATGAPYEYRTTDSLHYELCAVFDAADRPRPARLDDPTTPWRHGVGRQCFRLRVATASQPPR